MKGNKIAKILKSLGDPTRLRIFEMLRGGTKCACVLLKEFKISQPTLSYHMKYLLASGIVTCKKTGKWCNYSLDEKSLSELNEYLFAPVDNSGVEECRCNEKDIKP